MEAVDLTQHFSAPTHKSGHLLDLLLTRSSDQLIDSVSVVQSDLSNHSSILFSLDVLCQLPRITRMTGRNYKQLDLDAFQEDLTIRWDLSLEMLLTTCCKAPHTVTSCLDKQIPVTTRKQGSQKRCLWYKSDIHDMGQAKKRAEKVALDFTGG